MTEPATGRGPTAPDDRARAAVELGASAASTCVHLGDTRDVRPQSNTCPECLASGQSWVELRLCQECGTVACCDSSVGKHATAHFTTTGHPIAAAFDTGEDWGWCYVDELLIMPFSELQERARSKPG